MSFDLRTLFFSVAIFGGMCWVSNAFPEMDHLSGRYRPPMPGEIIDRVVAVTPFLACLSLFLSMGRGSSR